MSNVEIIVSVEEGGWEDELPDVADLCLRAAHAALARAEGVPAGPAELSVVLADDAVVHELNRQYRGQDKPTNVLSFAVFADAEDEEGPPAGAEGELHTECLAEGDGPPILLGDVILAFETCVREAREQCKPFPDHLTHLVIHGVLHLLGYDHIDDSEADAMERLETEILAGLGIDDPYAGSGRDGATGMPSPTPPHPT